MTDEHEDEEEIHEMWATIVEITPIGFYVQLDDDAEHGRVLIMRAWFKILGFKPETVAIGARIRCGVKITWTPQYFVSKVHTVVHEGGKSSS